MNLEDLMGRTRQLWYLEDIGTEYEGDDSDPRYMVDSIEKANLISSLIVNKDGSHMPALDMDHVVEQHGTTTFHYLLPIHFSSEANRQLLTVLDKHKLIHSISEYPSAHRLGISWKHPVIVHDSFTKGHHHFFLDVELSWADYREVLEALAYAGVIEDGYYQASDRRGASFLALKPWKESHYGKQES